MSQTHQTPSEPEVVRQDVTSTALSLTAPTNGTLAQGGTVQFDINAVVTMGTTGMRDLIDKNIKKQNKLLKAAQADLRKAEEEYAAEAAKVSTPAAFVSDLESVRVAILVFHPGAALDVANWDKKSYVRVERATRVVEVEGKIRAGGSAVFEAERSYTFAAYDRDYKTTLVAKADAIDARQQAVTDIQNKLTGYARDRHNVKEKADAMVAALVQHQMMLSKEGKATLDAMKERMNEHARLNGLETDLE